MKMPKEEEEYVCKRSRAAFIKQTYSRRANYTVMFTAVSPEGALLSMQRDPFKVKRANEIFITVLAMCLETVICYKH